MTSSDPSTSLFAPTTVDVVLGIETSCDETAASVVTNKGIESDVIWSQQVHQQYGGVVPELASRAHVDKVVSCTKAALEQFAQVLPESRSLKDISLSSNRGLLSSSEAGEALGTPRTFALSK